HLANNKEISRNVTDARARQRGNNHRAQDREGKATSARYSHTHEQPIAEFPPSEVHGPPRGSLLKFEPGLLIRPAFDHFFRVLITFLVGLLDAINAFPQPFSIVPNEICRLEGLCASGCASRSGIQGTSSLLTSE